MGIFEITLVGFGVAMDATTVAICNGISESRMRIRKALAIVLCFAFFQGLMPILGYYFGRSFASYLDKIDNYVVFIIFMVLGMRMIFSSSEENEIVSRLTYSKILVQGIATSIDALMIGVSFAILDVYIYRASLLIVIITIFMVTLGIKLGRRIGKKLKKKSSVLGGVILVVLAFKYLIEAFI